MRVNTVSVLLVLVLLCLGAGGWWVYPHIERYEEPAGQRFSAKALRDPYLAADYLLRELKAAPRRDSLPQQLGQLPAQGTVILTTPSNLVTEKQAAALIAWVGKGGHLITIAGSNSEANPDPLLRSFGVRRDFEWVLGKEARDGDAEKLSERLRELNKQIQSGKKLEDIANAESADLTDVFLEGDDTPLKVAFDRNYSLKHPAFHDDDDDDDEAVLAPTYWAQSADRIHFVQFALGNGVLTVVSDLDVWTSTEIGKHDHALLLQRLADPTRGISLIADVDVPPLPTLLWRRASELIIASVVLVLLWVWSRARRFGPINNPQPQVRRSLAEHIRASASCLWRSGHADALLAPSRRAVHQRARQLFAGYDNLDHARQLELLQQHCGIDSAQLQRALFDDPPRDANLFSDTVAILQRLHLHLTSNQRAQS